MTDPPGKTYKLSNSTTFCLERKCKKKKKKLHMLIAIISHTDLNEINIK